MKHKFFNKIAIITAALMWSVTTYAQEVVAEAAPPAPNFFNQAYNNILVVLTIHVLILVVLAGINLVWALINDQEWSGLYNTGAGTKPFEFNGPSIQASPKAPSSEFSSIILKSVVDPSGCWGQSVTPGLDRK